MPTPQITLTATLQTLSGTAAGTTANPAKLVITLCGYGLTLPQIAGTSTIAKKKQTVSAPSGTQVTVLLWGNDVITPLNQTFYSITVLDGEGNVVQTGNYRFTGMQTIDLSEATQIFPVVPPAPGGIPVITNPQGTFPVVQSIDGSITIQGNLVVDGSFSFNYAWVNASSVAGLLTVDCSLGSHFAITLFENVTSVLFENVQPGQDLVLLFMQDATGNWTVAWNPADVLNPIDPVNPTPVTGKTLQQLTVLPDSTLMAPGYAG